MNWYKKSLALPRIKNEYPKDDDKSGGIYYLDDALTKEHAEELSEPDMEYLGAGARGTAFGFEGKNIVKKFTKDNGEVSNAKKVMLRQQNNQPLEGFVYVYEVKYLLEDVKKHMTKNDPLENKTPTLYQITLEKIKPLNQFQKNTFSIYYDIIDDLIRRKPEIKNEEIFSKFNVGIKEKPFVIMIINFIIMTIMNHYLNTDIYYENVGIRNDNEIVVLDLGALKIYD